MDLDYQDVKCIVQFASFILSIFFNTLLIFLIVTKSPSKMGTYKYLMVYFSLFAMFFSTVDVILEPFIHSYGTTFVVVVDLSKTIMNRETVTFLIVVLCGCFGVTIGFFAIHFTFRYFALERKGKLAYFRGIYLVFWLFIPIIMGIVWGIFVYNFLGPNVETSEYIRESIWRSYNLNVDNVTYIGAFYWPFDEYGREYLNVKCCTGILLMCSMMMISFTVVFYYGIKSYSRIRKLIYEGESSFTRNLQKQLYKALVVQAIIPVLLMYTPVGAYMLP